MTNNFEESWQRIPISINHELVSPDLLPLVRTVYQKIAEEPISLLEIKVALEKLFVYLTTSGRTSANCCATDLFFTLADLNVNREGFPEELTTIFGDITQTLHDTFENPEIAKNFNGLPEQILESIRKWNPEIHPDENDEID
jgi:hypothetical protein